MASSGAPLSHYELLGLDPSSPAAEIKKAYRQLALKWHPDKAKSGPERTQASEMFKLINEAYAVLSDDERRQLYDSGGIPDPPTTGSYSQPRRSNFSNFTDFSNFSDSDARSVFEAFFQHGFVEVGDRADSPRKNPPEVVWYPL